MPSMQIIACLDTFCSRTHIRSLYRIQRLNGEGKEEHMFSCAEFEFCSAHPLLAIY